MTSRKIAHLPDRGVISIKGGDARHFLQGLITNDMAKLSGPGSALHAGLLSPQGKILFDFFVVQTSDGFLLETAREQVAALIKRLSLYKLRADVSLTDASELFSVMVLWGPDAASSGETTGTQSFIDPRTRALGRRILAEARFADDISSATNGTTVPIDHYHAHRVALGIPEGGRDYVFGDTYPHEADFDLFNGVSFTKGCYVGQEVVSRMQNKSVVRKRVVPVSGATALATGSDVAIANVVIGRIGTVAGNDALVLLRLDRVADAIESGGTIEANGVALTVSAAALSAYRSAAGAKVP